MTKKIFFNSILLDQIFNIKKITISRKDLSDLIDSELDKAPNEMDVELIDFCLDVLEGKYGKAYIKANN